MKIAILDAYCTNPGDIAWDPVSSLGECTFYDRTTPDQIVDRASGHEAILTNKVPITREVMEGLPELKYIGVLATGTNVVDIEAAHERGIVVTNIPAYSTDSVAQMVFALLLGITHHAEMYAELNRKGQWAHSADFCYWDSPLIELAGKRMGIVGFGNIGSRVARIADAFGMKVAAFTSKAETQLPPYVTKMELDTMLKESDVVSLHAPLTPETRNLINRERLALMKPSAILINTSRGPLVDEIALSEALAEGRLYAAGLDVMAQEPPRDDNPLFSLSNCLTTPHIAWATYEARKRLIDIQAANLHAFIAGKPVNVV